MQKIKVMIAEDHHSAREAYARFIEDEPNISVTGQAANGQELLLLVQQSPPDIVLLDLEMPILNGFQVLPLLKENHPLVKIIVFSIHKEAGLVSQLLHSGANAYLPKNCSMSHAIEALNTVYRHGFFINEVVSALMVHTAAKAEGTMQLSDRENKVLDLFCKGRSYREIADELYISLNTVKFHLKNIYKKTGLSSSAELVKYAIKSGITALS